ncbi:hypothetical protein BDV11DRAFT_167357 [Aspergillus similis]
MSPRRGGSSSFGGLPDGLPDGLFDGGTSSAGEDDDYGSSPSSSAAMACSQPGMPSWWNISFIVVTAIFLVIYIVIALWYISFLLEGRKIKGVPLLLRFRFGACLFCLILSTFLEAIFTGAYACSNMSMWDYVGGIIPAMIFLRISWLFLVFVALFPMSRAVRLARRYLSEVANSGTKHHSKNRAEKICQGVLLSCMIIIVTAHLFISSVNQGDHRTAVYDGFLETWTPIPGERETYIVFPFLQLLATGISVTISHSRVSKINHAEPRAQKFISRNRIYSAVLLARSCFMVIVTIAFDLVGAGTFEGDIAVLVLQEALDATLLASIIYLTRAVRSLKDANTVGPGAVSTTVQTGQSVAPVPSEMSAQTHPQISVAGAGHPVPVPDIPAYHSNTYAHPNLTSQQRAELEAVPRSQSPGQWVFVPHNAFPHDGQLKKA